MEGSSFLIPTITDCVLLDKYYVLCWEEKFDVVPFLLDEFGYIDSADICQLYVSAHLGKEQFLAFYVTGGEL